jgi:hypothetical protein
MGLNLGFFHLTPTANPFKHMNFSRNGNKRIPFKLKIKELVIEWLLLKLLMIRYSMYLRR